MKVNVIARLEFELAYYDVAVHKDSPDRYDQKKIDR